MKEYKTVEYPAHSSRVLIATHCDLCREKFSNEFRGCDAQESSVELSEGCNWVDDGGAKTTTSLDVCPECFRKELIPWFASKGATPSTVETDW